MIVETQSTTSSVVSHYIWENNVKIGEFYGDQVWKNNTQVGMIEKNVNIVIRMLISL
jgi:hypothetical protein